MARRASSGVAAPLGADGGERLVQADQRLQRLGRESPAGADRGYAQRLEGVLALGLLELDLQGGAAVGGVDRQQVGQAHAEGGGEGGQDSQPGLALAVLDQ